MTADLTIDHLNLNLSNAAGHEHRLDSIARRAFDLLSERLPSGLEASTHFDRLEVEPLSLRLATMSDDEAANALADALAEALLLKLKV